MQQLWKMCGERLNLFIHCLLFSFFHHLLLTFFTFSIFFWYFFVFIFPLSSVSHYSRIHVWPTCWSNIVSQCSFDLSASVTLLAFTKNLSIKPKSWLTIMPLQNGVIFVSTSVFVCLILDYLAVFAGWRHQHHLVQSLWVKIVACFTLWPKRPQLSPLHT